MAFSTLLYVGTIGQTNDVVAYAGNKINERFNDVLYLSDTTFVIVGVSTTLQWIDKDVDIRRIDAYDIDNKESSGGHIGFMLYLGGDPISVYNVIYFQPGAVDDVSFIKTNSLPNSTVDNVFISGKRSGGYYIARLNDNFINNVPNALDWVYNVVSNDELRERQPWDVGGDGKVVFAMGASDEETGTAAVMRLDANGYLDIVPQWRYHYASDIDGKDVQGAWVPAFSNKNVSVNFSAVLFKVDTAGSLRSWSSIESAFSRVDDENGNLASKAEWPMDVFFDTLSDISNPQSTMLGSDSLRIASKINHRIGAIAVDKSNNDIYIGASINSINPIPVSLSKNGDIGYVPFVIAYDNQGNKKWWNRLYAENITVAHDLVQHVNALSIDYIQRNLLIIATQKGRGQHNFWEGNKIHANPGASAFQNRFTGSNDVQISWMGKCSLNNGILNYCTYIAGYAETFTPSTTYSNNNYKDANNNLWQDHNADDPDLSETTLETNTYIGANGNVGVLVNSKRFITTSLAHQKQSSTGTVEAAHIRVYTPDLDSLIYSSALAGGTSTMISGDNTRLLGLHLFSNSAVVVGYQFGDDDGTSVGDPIPTENEPTWADNDSQGEEAIFAKLFFQPVKADFVFRPVKGNCLDSATIITDISSDNVTSWNWDFGADASIPTASKKGPHTLRWSSAGDKVIRLIVSDDRTGQKDTATHIYRISPIPDDTISVRHNGNIIGTLDTITMADGSDTVEVHFMASNAENSNYQYIWEIEDFNGIQHYRQHSFVHTYRLSGTYRVDLTVITESGCVLDLSRYVTIKDEKGHIFPDFRIISGDLCAQSPIIFDQVNDTNVVSWYWKFGDGALPFMSRTRGPHIVYYNTPGQKTATLTVGNGKVERSYVLHFDIDFVDKNISITAVPSLGSLDAPVMYNFSPVLTLTDPATLDYEWNFGNPFDENNNISRNKIASYVYETPGRYHVSLKVTTRKGCTRNIFKEINIGNANPDMTPNTADFIVIPSASACLDEAITITDMSRGYTFQEGQTRMYDFIDRNIEFIDYRNNGIALKWNTPGKKIIVSRVGDNNNEITTHSQLYNIFPYPNADFTVMGDTCVEPTSFILSANKQTDGSIYEWNIEGMGQQRSLKDTIQFNVSPDSAQATLTVISSDGCRALVSKKIHTCPRYNFVSPGIRVLYSSNNCTENIIIAESASTGTIEKFRWETDIPFDGPGPHIIPLYADIVLQLEVTYKDEHNNTQKRSISVNIPAP